jgi:hypothetical protein
MASRRLKNAHRKQEKKQRRLRRLNRKGERSPLGVPMSLVVSPPGMQKMSEVLEQFAEAYIDDVTFADQGLHELYSLCVLAWNTALLPENQHEEVLDKIVRECVIRGTESDRRTFRRLIESMVERKKTQFPNVNRGILAFDLKDTGDDTYYLNVVSTPG